MESALLFLSALLVVGWLPVLLLLRKKSELSRLLPLLDTCLVVLLAFPGLLRQVTARLV